MSWALTSGYQINLEINQIMNKNANTFARIKFNKIIAHKNYVCFDEYKNKRQKVLIWCSQGHGYERVAESILKGRSCKYCTNSGGFNKEAPAFIYQLRSVCGKYEKIGITNDIKKRITTLRKNTPFSFEVVSAKKYDDGEMVFKLEKQLKMTFTSPFEDKFDGYTEWRAL